MTWGCYKVALLHYGGILILYKGRFGAGVGEIEDDI